MGNCHRKRQRFLLTCFIDMLQMEKWSQNSVLITFKVSLLATALLMIVESIVFMLNTILTKMGCLFLKIFLNFIRTVCLTLKKSKRSRKIWQIWDTGKTWNCMMKNLTFLMKSSSSGFMCGLTKIYINCFSNSQSLKIYSCLLSLNSCCYDSQLIQNYLTLWLNLLILKRKILLKLNIY